MAERMKWTEIVKKYPDKWAFYTNVNYNENGDIIDCILLAAVSWNHFSDTFSSIKKKNIAFKWDCTTSAALMPQ